MIKSLLITLYSLMFMICLPLLASAQSSTLPPPPPGYHYERICYTSLVPFPHSQCDYRLVRNYRYVIPYHRHYSPLPPPPPHRNYGPRPGNHPPPPGPRPGNHPPAHHRR